MSPPIFTMPYELVSYVVLYLSIEDIYNFSLADGRLRYLVHEPNIAKKILDTKAQESPEARRARGSHGYGRELRRLVKRREALSSVRPFTAAIIAVADNWLYQNGVLLYTYERQLRILDLHNSASTEFVIDVRQLVGRGVKKAKSSKRYKFDLLHVSDDIVSCLYTHARPQRQSWLVIFNAKQKRVLKVLPLETSYKIFVRNNSEFLYYGTHTVTGSDGFRRWKLKAYDIRKDDVLEQPLMMKKMVGSDIGSTICFDIFDGYFYGLASSIRFDVQETEGTSFYRVFRFPTVADGFSKIEWAPRETMWRRQHAEGPIDDRWTFLRNIRDEETGEQRILESRKEWLYGHRSARRTYYMTCFGDFRPHEHYHSTSEGELVDLGEESGNDEDEEDEGGDSASPSMGDTRHSGGQSSGKSSGFMPPQRDYRMVHRGDDSDASLMFPLHKCHIRSYHPACETFLDLVDDPASGSSSQRIRIRGATRSIRTKLDPTMDQRMATTEEAYPDGNDKDPKDPSNYHEVLFWPPEQNPEQHDPALEDLTTLLNPPSHLGGIHERETLLTAPQSNHSEANVQQTAIEMEMLSDVPQQMSRGTGSGQWCRTERAMYLDIARGYHFFTQNKVDLATETPIVTPGLPWAKGESGQ
ncbi:hypothetical protein GQ53DRAFT_849234 [Thozetella sp. PMI_491]|nr:hypothetical protein GQ53DRAFT_849234 [Thozetella sp. PMI_491]